MALRVEVVAATLILPCLDSDGKPLGPGWGDLAGASSLECL